MKTPIRWAGSKLKSLRELRGLAVHRKGKYVEPFAGSACLFFESEPAAAVLGDLNPDLIGAYRALRDDCASVLSELGTMPRSKETYYEVRGLDRARLSPSRAAARFFYLNRYCFNGLYRTNKLGAFNVPFGHLKKNEQVDFILLAQASEMLQRATIVEGDFRETLDHAHAGDFVYMDPPYVTSSGPRLFSEYLPNSFGLIDLDRLEDCLSHLDRCGIAFAVSYADTPEARKALNGWTLTTTLVRRNIAGFSGHRKHAAEILVSNVRSAA